MKNYNSYAKHVLTAFALLALLVMQVKPSYAQEESQQWQEIKSSTDDEELYDGVFGPSVRFTLIKTKVDGGYKVRAKCNNMSQAMYEKEDSAKIDFIWGVKLPKNDMYYIKDNSQEIFVPLIYDKSEASVILTVAENIGCSYTLSIKLNPREMFYVYNQELFVKKDGSIRDDFRNDYLYNYDKIYMNYLPEVPDEAKTKESEIRRIKIFSPFIKLREYNGSIFDLNLNQVILPEEFEIIKNAEENKTYMYLLFIYNKNGEMIQNIPITITRKI